MRYSLLEFIECPMTRTALTCVVFGEAAVETAHARLTAATRVNPQGASIGPAPDSAAATPLAKYLRQNACQPAPDQRNYQVAVRDGLLISGETGRWYPIREFLPELLPDHLRDFDRDFAFLRERRGDMAPELFDALNDRAPFAHRGAEDTGSIYKRAEMSIADKVAGEDGFFGPGYISPFNPGAQEHTVHLIRLFAYCLPLLPAGPGNRVVLDTGCGYGWTTEWLLKSGFEPIGSDITRTYLDIGIVRAHAWLPHLIVADTENLPIREGAAAAVLGYESFHHIPDRARAMRGFFRALKPGGRVVLAEPGGAHEHAQCSIDAMDKYGILERGMDLTHVAEYAAGSGFAAPRQHEMLHIDRSAAGAALTPEFLEQHRFAASNIYTLDKPAAATTVSEQREQPRQVTAEAHDGSILRRLRRALVRP